MPNTVIEEYELEDTDYLDETDDRVAAALYAAGLIDEEGW